MAERAASKAVERSEPRKAIVVTRTVGEGKWRPHLLQARSFEHFAGRERDLPPRKVARGREYAKVRNEPELDVASHADQLSLAQGVGRGTVFYDRPLIQD